MAIGHMSIAVAGGRSSTSTTKNSTERGLDMRRFWRNVDRAAGELNPYLLIVAIGLVVIDFLVLVAKAMPPAFGVAQ
jgi:hypothetical protein